MAQKLSYSMLALAWSVAPAFAGGGGSEDGTGLAIFQTVAHLVQKVIDLGWF